MSRSLTGWSRPTDTGLDSSECMSRSKRWLRSPKRASQASSSEQRCMTRSSASCARLRGAPSRSSWGSTVPLLRLFDPVAQAHARIMRQAREKRFHIMKLPASNRLIANIKSPYYRVSLFGEHEYLL